MAPPCRDQPLSSVQTAARRSLVERRPSSTGLNHPSAIGDEAIEYFPQDQVNISLAELPTDAEVAKAIRGLSNGKASAADVVPDKNYAAGPHL